MSDPFVGEIRLFAGQYAPEGWLPCDGRLLNIGDYNLLFHVLHTVYGGDGTATFGLPDLRRRIPIGTGQLQATAGSRYALGEHGGAETVTLTVADLPDHSHAMRATKQPATQTTPGGGLYATSATGFAAYTTHNPNIRATTLATASITSTGGGQAHDNVMPSMPLTYIIAATGYFPNSPSKS